VILWSRQEAAACGGEETRARGLAARGLDLRKPIHALLSECLSGGGSLGRLGRESGARLLDPSLCDPSRTASHSGIGWSAAFEPLGEA